MEGMINGEDLNSSICSVDKKHYNYNYIHVINGNNNLGSLYLVEYHFFS